jgi:mycothiol synthase
MSLIRRSLTSEEDYQRFQRFLREVFLLNGRREHAWHVAFLDHWRWHFIATCRMTPPWNEITIGWETKSGELAAVLNPFCHDESHLHIHPNFRTRELEEELFAYAEEHYSDVYQGDQRIHYAPAYAHDHERLEILISRGYQKDGRWEHHWYRDLRQDLPGKVDAAGYELRSMGGKIDFPARSWCSWRTFHADEPDAEYDGDHSWYANMQAAPLYRNDLDLVAVTPADEMAAFCTISFDGETSSALVVLDGTSADHLGKGLIETLLLEGMHRLKKLGCTQLIAYAEDETTDQLYRSLMHDFKRYEPWFKTWKDEN